MGTAKTIALVVLGFLFVVLALHQPELPKPAEHPVELNPAFIAVQNELARTKETLAATQAALAAQKAAAADAVAAKEREERWAAAADAEARGALRTASKLYEEYAKTYPGSKQAQLATSRAKKTAADSDARRSSAPAEAPPAPPAAPAPP